uniref:Uncharacterized protein n=1 Tax=Triticum urartu TaxID=4572 RepID=A0A8R7QC41_TRIUA
MPWPAQKAGDEEEKVYNIPSAMDKSMLMNDSASWKDDLCTACDNYASVVYGGGKLTLQGALPRSDPVHHQA